MWDDVIFSEEPVIRRWSGLWNIWFSPADIRNEGHYWPIVYTTFWLEHKLWGLAPFGYHLVNVLLHLVNSLLVWRLLQRLDVPGAWAVAAVFAVHPLHVESVAWIIERKDLLSALFYLGAVLVWLRFDEAPHPARYCLALVLFVAGLLSKSIVVTLPAALLVWCWWKRGRVTAGDALRVAPFFLIGLAITAADYAYYSSRESVSLGYSLAERALIAARALWFYAGKLVWPTDLAAVYPLWDIRVGDLLGWVYVAAAAGLAALLWAARHRIGRGPLAGAAFFVVTLSPVLGFVDFGYMQFSFVADRFQYLAGIGVIAVLVGGAAHAVHRWFRGTRVAATGCLAVAIALLGVLTWRQCGIYRDEITFFSHVISLNPDARDVYVNFGSALFEAGRMEEGHAATLLAVEKRPDSPRAHANLGRRLMLLERYDEAHEHLTRALDLEPGNPITRQSMAELLRRLGRYEEAAEWFRKALAHDATNASALGGLGTSLFELGRYEEAVESIRRALELAPESSMNGPLHGMAGKALMALARLDEAERHLQRAAVLDPDGVDALLNLSALDSSRQRFDAAEAHLRRALERAAGNAARLHVVAEALRERERDAEAIESYRAVLEIDPDHAMAHAGMGASLYRLERYAEAVESLGRSVDLHPHPPTATTRLILMGTASRRLGRREAAVAHFERAVEIDPRNSEALDNLAMARFKAGRYEEALDFYRAIIEIKPDSAQNHSNLGATLYYLGRPEDALRSFERALALDPDLPSARHSVEDLRRRLGAGGG